MTHESFKATCIPDNNPLKGRDLLRLLDLSPEEFHLVLDVAAKQKAAWKEGTYAEPYRGRAVAILMDKPSLRTRTSFEVGTARLGAHPVIMADKNSAFSRGESVKDTSLVLERYVDAIVYRTFEQERLQEIADYVNIPVVNALTDDYHPCQGLADALTIQEHKGTLSGLTLAYVGDGNNMAHTYLEMGALAGMTVKIASPKGYESNKKVVQECTKVAEHSGATLILQNDPQEAVSGADVVITDTWASMGEEEEHDERAKVFSTYQINRDLMTVAGEKAIFMHCLPAHRGEEVTDDVMDCEASVIYDEAENRLHAQKALLSLVMDTRPAGER